PHPCTLALHDALPIFTRGWRPRTLSPGTTLSPQDSSWAIARCSDSSSVGPDGAISRTVSPAAKGAVSRYGLNASDSLIPHQTLTDRKSTRLNSSHVKI